jgi:hypothetical protein
MIGKSEKPLTALRVPFSPSPSLQTPPTISFLLISSLRRSRCGLPLASALISASSSRMMRQVRHFKLSLARAASEPRVVGERTGRWMGAGASPLLILSPAKGASFPRLGLGRALRLPPPPLSSSSGASRPHLTVHTRACSLLNAKVSTSPPPTPVPSQPALSLPRNPATPPCMHSLCRRVQLTCVDVVTCRWRGEEEGAG